MTESRALAKRGGGVARYESKQLPALSAEEVRARVNLIQQVMKGVMKKGIHYGPIPGAGEKPMLYKPGAETLSVTFQLSHEYTIEDLSDIDLVHYRIRDRIGSQATGKFICEGVGECSSDEEKYRWRKAVCDQEFDETPEDRRRVKWAHGRGGSAYQVKQVRTNPADVANTVLKMGKKRAQTDGVLTATGASDVFGQDLEDLPDELRTQLAEDVIEGEFEEEEPVSAETLAELRKLAATKDNGRGKPFVDAALLRNVKRANPDFTGELDAITQPPGRISFPLASTTCAESASSSRPMREIVSPSTKISA